MRKSRTDSASHKRWLHYRMRQSVAFRYTILEKPQHYQYISIITTIEKQSDGAKYCRIPGTQKLASTIRNRTHQCRIFFTYSHADVDDDIGTHGILQQRRKRLEGMQESVALVKVVVASIAAVDDETKLSMDLNVGGLLVTRKHLRSIFLLSW